MLNPAAGEDNNPPASQYEGHTSLWSALTDGIVNADQARGLAREMQTRVVAFSGRWIEHYDNRLAYERAMLAEAGGTIADKTGPEMGRARYVGLHPEGQQDQRHPACRTARYG